MYLLAEAPTANSDDLAQLRRSTAAPSSMRCPRAHPATRRKFGACHHMIGGGGGRRSQPSRTQQPTKEEEEEGVEGEGRRRRKSGGGDGEEGRGVAGPS